LSVNSFEELMQHKEHKIKIVTYGEPPKNIAIECLDCNTVLMDFDNTTDELELTDEMLARNDDIDNAVHKCICTLVEKEIDWDMEIIGDVTEAIKTVLHNGYGIKVYHPSVIIEKDGTQHYGKYDY